MTVDRNPTPLSSVAANPQPPTSLWPAPQLSRDPNPDAFAPPTEPPERGPPSALTGWPRVFPGL